ncbi:MAG: hypothetical protein A2126_01530 [Candidatus Woykebacteria bacterium GWB1_45_5]|uniref:Blue (type 1) copper domain-containing protein n=2 Tax=Candidatus Woykeibacteriota TaxID=1817899 RepID=A0A1G1W2R4_9BACT|nr:MAG: hypothetical protein A2113_00770 [Candidatus Woykebacteria bacterium GWA1_44_8]OGY22660.1 MAG: hypothetical protein A2126_01530 [Candidatus Woykebacteria bacterium GWB1_45_5]
MANESQPTTNTSETTKPNTVSIESFSFKPSEITVKAGTEVTWMNNDSVTHTVTSDTNAFESGELAAGETYKHTFEEIGTFAYHCTPHSSMTGKVTVQ